MRGSLLQCSYVSFVPKAGIAALQQTTPHSINSSAAGHSGPIGVRQVGVLHVVLKTAKRLS